MNRLQASEQRYANLKMLWEKSQEENQRLRNIVSDCNHMIELMNQGVQRLGYLSQDTWTVIDVVHAAIKKELSDGKNY